MTRKVVDLAEARRERERKAREERDRGDHLRNHLHKALDRILACRDDDVKLTAIVVLERLESILPGNPPEAS